MNQLHLFQKKRLIFIAMFFMIVSVALSNAIAMDSGATIHGDKKFKLTGSVQTLSNLGVSIEKILDKKLWHVNLSKNFRMQRFLYPVIFIHGYGGSGESWNEARRMLTVKKFLFGGHFDLRTPNIGGRLKKRLIQKDYQHLKGFKTGDFYTISFSKNDQLTFYEQAKELKLVIDAVKKINTTDKVILVGHSMGGLASRAYIQYPDLYRKDVHALVTMATPHLGSFLGYAYDIVRDIKKKPQKTDLDLTSSANQLTLDILAHLKAKGFTDNDLAQFQEACVKLVSILLAVTASIDISSPATQYLQPTSMELKKLNQLDIPLDIDLVNVISDFNLEKLKPIILLGLKAYNRIGKATTTAEIVINFPHMFSLAWATLDKKSKPKIRKVIAAFLQNQLEGSKISVTDLYQWLQCDLLDLCKKVSGPLSTFFDKMNIATSDGVVPMDSQLIYLFPLSRENQSQNAIKNIKLSKELQDKTQVNDTDLFHIDVNKSETETVTWGAIKKYSRRIDQYKHIIFVIDSSGSMGQTDPSNIRILGPSILLKKLTQNTFVSLIDFDHEAKVKVEYKSAGKHFQTIKHGFSSINAKGNTHIAKALKQGIKLAEKYGGQVAIFLLTDGQDNGKSDILAIAEKTAEKIPIYTIGLTGQVNEQLLSKIADITHGKYFKAISSQQLFSKLNIMLCHMTMESLLLNQTGQILQNQIQKKTLMIDSYSKKVSVVLSWMGSRIDLSIIKPDGTIVDPSSVQKAGIQFFPSKTNVVATIDPDQTGEWTLVLYGADIPARGEGFHLTVNAESDFSPAVALKNQYAPGEAIPLQIYMDIDKINKTNIKMILENARGEKKDLSNAVSFQTVAEGDYKLTTIIDGELKNGEFFNRILVNEFRVEYDSTKILTLPQIGMTMRWIEPGNFMMGSDEGPSNGRPAHKVTISKGFWMAESEVTQAMWKKIMAYNPSEFKTGGSHPVETVSHSDCMIFLDKLSKLSGMRCRLPSEAEWEYACRAGTTTRFSWGETILPDHLRKNEEWSLGHSPVKLFAPNDFGLFDMHSNVWEWCADWYDPEYYAASHKTDPKGPNHAQYRSARGGAWCYGEDDMVAFKRTAILDSRKLGNLGFRFVIDK